MLPRFLAVKNVTLLHIEKGPYYETRKVLYDSYGHGGADFGNLDQGRQFFGIATV
jgi:hypothetical protein